MMTEFGLIAAAKQLTATLPTNGFEGIGDDCATLPLGEGEVLCFTADLVVEKIHFLREEMTPEEVASKALHVNLSDVAAMGIRPVATLLSLALPPEAMQSDWAERFMRGYIAASKEAKVTLIGGDTTASKEGITINVTAIGRGPMRHLKRRSEAQAGDLICVTGTLGGSAAGLREILSGTTRSALAELHKHPIAQIEEGVWLGGREEVHAMMDISDGIASDLRHILEASHLGGEVELSRVPQFPGATLEEALTGGEEYKLLFTLSADYWESFSQAYQTRFGTLPYPIGRITSTNEAPHLRWLQKGKEITANWQGFRHY